MANTTADKLALLAANKTEIKAAINAKNPTTAPTDVMSQWPTAIASIPSGGGVTVEALSVTENGTYDGTSQGKAYSPVTVAVDDVWPKPWANDGKTHLWYYFAPKDYKMAYFTAQYVSAGHTFSVDWGDGSVDTIAASSSYTTRSLYHTFSSCGPHEVVISGYDGISMSQSNAFGVYNSDTSASNGAIRQIEVGGNVGGLGGAFIAAPSVVAFRCSSQLDLGGRTFTGDVSLAVVDIDPTSIGYDSFKYTKSLMSASFPHCASIGSSGMSSSGIKSVSLPVCETLGDTAFGYCSSLESVSLPSCTSIANASFRSCTKMESASLPLVQVLPTNAFNGCSSLESVTIPSCTSVATSTFIGTNSIADIYMATRTHTEVEAITGFTYFPNLGTACVFHCSDGDYYRSGSSLLPMP